MELTPCHFPLQSWYMNTSAQADGKANLYYVPTAAPAAAFTIKESRTLSGFRFGRTSEQEVYNDFQALYDPVYAGEKAGSWAGDKTDSDATSKAKYGTFRREYELWPVRNGTQMTDWLAFRKLWEKDVLIPVEFEVHRRDICKGSAILSITDTFDIVATLHNGMKFLTEEIEELREDFYRVRGIGWPT